MLPLLRAEDQVLVRSVSPDTLKPGDIVVARHPHQRDVTMVKQIEAVTGEGRFVLSGLNPEESTDSRQFGNIAPEDVVGIVSAAI